ncbi:hypothetical protein B0H14DRAFT_2575950 [Mycena olivaceomarginata]|nr:hypothetical protein B0H14DRAFT_2575950 [Mycena olivaceomarginata]
MITNKNLQPPSIAPFRPRQRRACVPRPTPRADRFHAIRSRRPSPTSNAACARYRLGRKAAVRDVTLTKWLNALEKYVQKLQPRILHLLDTSSLHPLSAVTTVIHDIEAASSSFRALSAAYHSHSIPQPSSSSSMPLHGALKPATPSAVASSNAGQWILIGRSRDTGHDVKPPEPKQRSQLAS